jgi:hypothetical protein
VILSRAELIDLTGRRYSHWQARELDHLEIPYKRRSDGTLVVLRKDVEGKQDPQPRREPHLRAG